MKTTVEFLDAVKAKNGGISDYALAKVLGVTQQTVSRYRTKKDYLGDAMAIRVAELLEIDSAFVLACSHAERAKGEAEKAAWVAMVEKLGGLAASVVLGVSLFAAPAPAQAAPSAQAGTICIMSIRRKRIVEAMLSSFPALLPFRSI